MITEPITRMELHFKKSAECWQNISETWKALYERSAAEVEDLRAANVRLTAQLREANRKLEAVERLSALLRSDTAVDAAVFNSLA